MPPERIETWPAMLPEPPSSAPLKTVTAVLPSAPFIESRPAFTLVGPVYVLVAVRMRLPGPCCTSDPVPVSTRASVTASLRLKASTPALLMEPVPPSVPAVAPVPTCSVPAEIVVLPE